jgi:hypothetical protein
MKLFLFYFIIIQYFSFSIGKYIFFQKLDTQVLAKKCCETYYPTQTIFYCNMGGGPGGNNQQVPKESFIEFNNRGYIEPFMEEPEGQIFGGEPRVGSVQPVPGTNSAIGDWVIGDIYFINSQKPGAIVKITNKTNIDYEWVVITEESNPGIECVFDRAGQLFQGDLLCTFPSSVYRIFANGSHQLISDKLNNYEGVNVVPSDVNRYGPLASTVLLPQNGNPPNNNNGPPPPPPPPGGKRGPPGGGPGGNQDNCGNTPTGGANIIAAVHLNGSIDYYYPDCHADQVWIPLIYDNFYGLDIQTGFVLAANWSVIEQNGLVGEIIIQCEVPLNQNCKSNYTDSVCCNDSGLRRMYWNGTNVVTEPIILLNGSAIPHTWEHGCFSKGGSGNMLPGGFSFCYYANDNYTNLLRAYQISTLVENNYPSSLNNTFSYSGMPHAADHMITITLIQDISNSFYLQIVNGNPNNENGFLDLFVQYNGPYVSNIGFPVQNNPPPSDYYNWINSSGNFIWKWSSGTTGIVLGPLQAIPAMQPFSFDFFISNYSGLTGIQLYSNNNNPIFISTISQGLKFSIQRVSCSCGTGNITDPTLEECDYTNPGASCCAQNCLFKPSLSECGKPSNDCEYPTYCNGSSSYCPPVINVTCNQSNSCPPHHFGENCENVICSFFNSCSSCNEQSGCLWCCTSSVSLCIPSKQNSSCPSIASSCNCSGGCGSGTCNCGKCVCPPTIHGKNCNETLACNGKLYPIGDPNITKVDVCGFCGGNGTECLGCNGVPFGERKDICGVCGGNGESCYDPCSLQKDCIDCLDITECAWCPSTKNCSKKTNTTTECSNLYTSQSQCYSGGINPAILGASIGAGVIAAISIGSIVFVGAAGYTSKKGYEHWKKKMSGTSGVINNPLYENKSSFDNPLFDNENNNL